ncbi:MAG: hypothetical protein WD689_04415 [Gaiellaceae bacterium]
MNTLCMLQYGAGRVEECPGSRCPFWLSHGCVLAGGEAEIAARPQLADHLLELRLELDRARAASREQSPRSLFYRLLNEEQGADAA